MGVDVGVGVGVEVGTPGVGTEANSPPRFRRPAVAVFPIKEFVVVTLFKSALRISAAVAAGKADA